MKKQIIDLTEAEKSLICDSHPNCNQCPHNFQAGPMTACKLYLDKAFGQEWAEVEEEEVK